MHWGVFANSAAHLGPNGILAAQKFCDIFLGKIDIRYQYINSLLVNCFLLITLKFILSLVSRGLGALQGNFGTAQTNFFRPAKAGPHFRYCDHYVYSLSTSTKVRQT
jgi:hypothetical protein